MITLKVRGGGVVLVHFLVAERRELAHTFGLYATALCNKDFPAKFELGIHLARNS